MSDRIIGESSSNEEISEDEDIEEQEEEEEEEVYSDSFEQSDLDCTGKSPVPPDMKKISRPAKHKNGRPKIEPLLISQKTRVSSSRVSSRGSSAGSRNPVVGSSRSDSLNSSMTVVSLKRRSAHIQARINSAKRKNQTELVNSIAALKIEIQDLTEDNRNLRRLVTRQERELGRFTKTEADLPVILRAHNEESRVLKMKIRQAQDSNKKLSVNIKKKDQQLLGLMEENKQLKKINSLEMKDETYILEEKLSDVTRLLDSRDNEFKDLLKKQDILEKSHKQQMRTAFKKCRSLTEENKEKEIKINQLEATLKKSPASLQKSSHSISTVNLSSTEKESFIETLEARLSTFNEKSKDSPADQVDQITESQSVSNEQVKPEDANNGESCDNSEGETSHNDSDAEAESSASEEESEAGDDSQEEEERVEEKEDTNIVQEKKDVSLSPREKVVESMSTAEKVKIWLPQAQTTGRDIQISIDESQKVALLAKLNEIDSDKGRIEASEDRLESTSVQETNNNNMNQIEKKSNLMEELFGEKAIIPRRKDTFTLGSKPLKTSLRTFSSGPSKSVKFVED